MSILEWPDVLRAAGVQVVERPGWQSLHQTDGEFHPRGLIFHHDGSAVGASPTEPDYMADLSHPGAQLWVSTTGVWVFVAGGRMWHAGLGAGWGVIPKDAGNTYSVGRETDHTTGESWPVAQIDALIKGDAAVFAHEGWDPHNALCGHKEYAPGRKPDPDPMDMDWYRAQVAAQIAHPQGDDPLSALASQEQRDLYNRIMGFCRQRWYVLKDGAPVEVPEGTPDAIPAHALDTLDGNYLVDQFGGLLTAVQGVKAGTIDTQTVADELKATLGAEVAADLAARLAA